MSTGLSLENLAQIIHTDKQRMYAEERFARQVELAQSATPPRASRFLGWAHFRPIAARRLIVTLAVYPFRLTLQWA